EEKLPVCIVDMGASSTLIGIFDKTGLLNSYSINIAGDHLTEELVKKLKIRHKQAESYKEKYGLADQDSQVSPMLIKVLEPVVAEIKTALNFYHARKEKTIQGVILLGGTSRLKGLKEYLQVNLETNIWAGNSCLIGEKSPLENIEAIGLAIGGLDQKYSDLFIKYKNEEALLNLQKFDFKVRGKKILIGLLNKFKFKSQAVELVVNESKVEDESMGQSDDQPKANSISGATPNKKKIIGLLICAVILFSGAFWYKESQNAKRVAAIKVQAEAVAKNQVLKIEIPIAVDASEYSPDKIKGSFVSDNIVSAQNVESAIQVSRERVLKTLVAGERIWDQPVNTVDKNKVVFPLLMDWLVFKEADADELIKLRVDKLNSLKVKYDLVKIDKIGITYSNNPNVVILTSNVIISTKDAFLNNTSLYSENKTSESVVDKVKESGQKVGDIPVDNIVKEVKKAVVSSINNSVVIDKRPKVLVLATELGWLNVRSKPSATSSLVIKIKPGESYPLLEQKEKWYKLEISNDQVGWVSTFYTKVVK
ncbi:MAG: pilus assembly protein PilM, partial [Candidatus Falkowbacteria bacterium]|nr:pilus assembly protein PilM [Candidatus Falkowbacteria bacterium]